MIRATGCVALGLALVVIGCDKRGSTQDTARFRVEALDRSTVNLIPSPGQLPFCLAFSASDSGVVRLLTMTGQNEAIVCDPGVPIGGVSYRIPDEDGHVRLIVVFTDQAIEAAPLASQVREISYKRGKVTGMDLRAPGTITVDSIEFNPPPR